MKTPTPKKPGNRLLASGSGSAAVVWSRAEPTEEGWWWIERNGESVIVAVKKIRARGNLLCAWLPTFREWMRVDEITLDVTSCRWGGKIPLPSEPPNAELKHGAKNQ